MSIDEKTEEIFEKAMIHMKKANGKGIFIPQDTNVIIGQHYSYGNWVIPIDYVPKQHQKRILSHAESVEGTHIAKTSTSEFLVMP